MSIQPQVIFYGIIKVTSDGKSYRPLQVSDKEDDESVISMVMIFLMSAGCNDYRMTLQPDTMRRKNNFIE
jgi:hypothetical protein